MFPSSRNILWTLGKRIGRTSLITNCQAIYTRQEEIINAHHQTNSRPINSVRENSITFAKVLRNNVPNSEHLLGIPTVVCYKALEKPENVTFESTMVANVVGWCVEMLLSQVVILDDVVDNSPLRFNRPSWYKQKDVGLMAIYDALMIESGIPTLLRKYLGDKKCYTYIQEQFRAVSTEAIIGQTMEMLFKTPDGTPSLDLFTMSRFKTKTQYLVGSYSCLPMSLAMYLANIYDHKEHAQAKRICLEMGELFRMQNDFLDCFGNPEGTGKVSSDIKEGKCTWLAVVALQRATPAQKNIMEKHYGKEDEKDVQMIKDLYLELDLPAIYAAAEEELFLRIETHIRRTYNGQLQEALLKLLKQRYNFKNSRLSDIC